VSAGREAFGGPYNSGCCLSVAPVSTGAATPLSWERAAQAAGKRDGLLRWVVRTIDHASRALGGSVYAPN
jgi:hypothetical protein